MTGYGAIESAVDAIREGAYHYLTKPFPLDELALFLGRALEHARVRGEARSLRAELRDRVGLGTLVAKSAAMREVFDVASRIADAETPVLIMGETGTGKSALARAIHATSARAGRPFVAVNCAALPESLLESELFGHVKGAFTGATSARAGLFAEADGGTLLLDEVGEMSPALQAKLLHVIESGSGPRRRLGQGAHRSTCASSPRPTATCANARAPARSGRICSTASTWSRSRSPLSGTAARTSRSSSSVCSPTRRRSTAHSPVEGFAPEAMAKLLDHPWPGNVRELAHAIERVVLLGRGPEVAVADLPPNVMSAPPPGLPDATGGPVLPIREVQRRYAAWALETLGGHKARTAEALDVDKKTLAKWLGGE